jgi:hypothetical protein
VSLDQRLHQLDEKRHVGRRIPLVPSPDWQHGLGEGDDGTLLASPGLRPTRRVCRSAADRVPCRPSTTALSGPAGSATACRPVRRRLVLPTEMFGGWSTRHSV